MTINFDTRICNTNCRKKLKNGNCEIPGSDNLAFQCVGPWVENKYFFLEKYLNISRAVRRKFSEKNNAVYIDLFSGPGRCFVNVKTHNKKNEIDNGSIRVIKRDEAPFNEFYFCDIDALNIESLKARILDCRKSLYSRCSFHSCDSNLYIHDLIKDLLSKNWRYHFVYIDPYGPEGLKFSTIIELSKLKRIDILLHFPIGAIKRNYKNWTEKNLTEKEKNILNDFLGTNTWKQKYDECKNIYRALIETLIDQLKILNYINENIGIINSKNYEEVLPVAAIKNTKNVKLYELILISKNIIASDFWSKALEIGPNGQKKLF